MCKAVLGSHSYPLSYGIRIIEVYETILHTKVCTFPLFFTFRKYLYNRVFKYVISVITEPVLLILLTSKFPPPEEHKYSHFIYLFF